MDTIAIISILLDMNIEALNLIFHPSNPGNIKV